ncbi:hypothetical protein SAMN02745216_04779 [Desulfatibacillum alkenivorans DSM 16219]|jgi:hypothetical protein|uniref:Uncharacterized protein n=1 Tax=Desulfatibacillum alkenivorans DSM 16219 TaxID=1121393 RepID=A0A1M6YL10_9BACT|nr:hypothetical protein [Desulfatibacillum alkenivorans]SHL18928.1 hypothetical protein SAMN02745216_04779 [Desulfatibacillum alkenivorans DSM 16219]
MAKKIISASKAMENLSEHEHQTALIKWAAKMEETYPELALLHAIPNGVRQEMDRSEHMAVTSQSPIVFLRNGRSDMLSPGFMGCAHRVCISLLANTARPSQHHRGRSYLRFKKLVVWAQP